MSEVMGMSDGSQSRLGRSVGDWGPLCRVSFAGDDDDVELHVLGCRLTY